MGTQPFAPLFSIVTFLLLGTTPTTALLIDGDCRT